MNTAGVTRVLLIVALLGFFLPFFSVSCSGEKLMSLTGTNMVTGVTVESSGSMSSTRDERQIDPSPFAIGAALVGLIGLAASFRSGRPGRTLPAGAGLLATVSLLVLYSRVMAEADDMPLSVDTEFGFWLTLMAFAGAALAGAWPSLTRRADQGDRKPGAGPGSRDAGPPPEDPRPSPGAG